MAPARSLYSDQMKSMMGLGGGFQDNPVRNIRRSRESLEHIEEDQLDSTHDQLDIMDEQLKILKKIAKFTEKAANNNGGSASSLLGDVLGSAAGAGIGGGIWSKLRGKIPSPSGAIRSAANFGKDLTKDVAGWTRRVTGSISQNLTNSARYARSATGRILTGSIRSIRSMSSTILSSISDLMGSVASLSMKAFRGAGRLAAKILTPVFAAWDSFENYKEINKLDKNNKLGTLEKTQMAIGGAANDATFGLGDWISKKLSGDPTMTFNKYNTEAALNRQRASERSDSASSWTNTAESVVKLLWNNGAGMNLIQDQLNNKNVRSANKVDANVNNIISADDLSKQLSNITTNGDSNAEFMGFEPADTKVNPVTANTVKTTPITGTGSTPGAAPADMPKFQAFDWNNFLDFLHPFKPFDPKKSVEDKRAAWAQEKGFHYLAATAEATKDTAKNTDKTNKTLLGGLAEKVLGVADTPMGDRSVTVGDTASSEMLDGTTQGQKSGNGAILQNTVKEPLRSPGILNPSEYGPSVIGKDAQPGGFTGLAGKYTPVNARTTSGAGSSAILDGNKRVISTASTDMKPYQRGLLDTIAMGNATSGSNYWESPDYNTINGGQKFSDMTGHPNVFGPSGKSTAAGRYQITKSTYDEFVPKWNKLHPNDQIKDFSASSQDKLGYFIAQERYRSYTGQDLDTDLQNGDYSKLKQLGPTWAALAGKSSDEISAAANANITRNSEYQNTVPSDSKAVSQQSLFADKIPNNPFEFPKLGEGNDPRFNVVGNAKSRDINKVDKRLPDIIRQASGFLPEGYRAEMFSGYRPGDPRNHGKGNAGDFRIIGPDGKELPNYKSPENFRMYEQLAQNSRKIQQDKYPELNDSFRWGGYFTGGKKNPITGYGGNDLMHFDIDNKNGMGAGSWKNGLNPAFRGVYDSASNPSVGMGDNFQLPQVNNPTSKMAMAVPTEQIINKSPLPSYDQLLSSGVISNPGSTPYGDTFKSNFNASSMMRDRGTISGQGLLEQQGAAIAKGIVDAEKSTPKVQSFDPQTQNSAIMSSVDEPIKNSQVSASPRGNTSNQVTTPKVSDIPHTDELTMLMANSEMMG